MNNQEVCNYFTASFQYLIDYGLEKQIINKAIFLSKDSGKYPKYLNF